MPTKEIQTARLVEEDLAPYSGSWVAVREGKVVASALDAIELRDQPGVRDDDWLILVPSGTDGAFLL